MLGAVPGPSALLGARTACIALEGRRGLKPHMRAAPPQQGWGTGGGPGFSVRCDRLPADHTTLHVRVKALGFLGPRSGFWGPHPGAVGPPCSVSEREAWVGARDKGHSRPCRMARREGGMTHATP